MERLMWSSSQEVFVPEMDDEHKEIYQALSDLQTALSNRTPPPAIGKWTRALMLRLEAHFSHEERLMRAARYGSLRWHKQTHDSARKRMTQFSARIGKGDAEAGPELVEYLTEWLRDHTRIADMMLAAFLRNHRRGLAKVIFRAGTKPMDACEWFDVNGEKV